jgi:hypothetical protein
VLVAAHRWHGLGTVSPLKGNDHLVLVEPLESDEDARLFREIIQKHWPGVMRNDISAEVGFTIQKPSLANCPDLRVVEA